MITITEDQMAEFEAFLKNREVKATVTVVDPVDTVNAAPKVPDSLQITRQRTDLDETIVPVGKTSDYIYEDGFPFPVSLEIGGIYYKFTSRKDNSKGTKGNRSTRALPAPLVNKLGDGKLSISLGVDDSVHATIDSIIHHLTCFDLLDNNYSTREYLGKIHVEFIRA
ncbi:hypothetical protein BC829DRAFT_411121 [Chytridium lagenaria]|nr:hypothetical protein BC829DRAFT_411121 [Chytridium lagenaria]